MDATFNNIGSILRAPAICASRGVGNSWRYAVARVPGGSFEIFCFSMLMKGSLHAIEIEHHIKNDEKQGKDRKDSGRKPLRMLVAHAGCRAPAPCV